MKHFTLLGLTLSILVLGLTAPLARAADADAYDAAWAKKNGYEMTPTTCNFSDDVVCPSSLTCIPDTAESDSGHCYTKGSTSGAGLINLLKVDSLPALLSIVMSTLVQIGTLILVLALVWTGFKFVAAQGNEEEIRNARSALTWTVVGGLLLLGAEALSLVISATIESL